MAPKSKHEGNKRKSKPSELPNLNSESTLSSLLPSRCFCHNLSTQFCPTCTHPPTEEKEKLNIALGEEITISRDEVSNLFTCVTCTDCKEAIANSFQSCTDVSVSYNNAPPILFTKKFPNNHNAKNFTFEVVPFFPPPQPPPQQDVEDLPLPENVLNVNEVSDAVETTSHEVVALEVSNQVLLAETSQETSAMEKTFTDISNGDILNDALTEDILNEVSAEDILNEDSNEVLVGNSSNENFLMDDVDLLILDSVTHPGFLTEKKERNALRADTFPTKAVLVNGSCTQTLFCRQASIDLMRIQDLLLPFQKGSVHSVYDLGTFAPVEDRDILPPFDLPPLNEMAKMKLFRAFLNVARVLDNVMQFLRVSFHQLCALGNFSFQDFYVELDSLENSRNLFADAMWSNFSNSVANLYSEREFFSQAFQGDEEDPDFATLFCLRIAQYQTCINVFHSLNSCMKRFIALMKKFSSSESESSAVCYFEPVSPHNLTETNSYESVTQFTISLLDDVLFLPEVASLANGPRFSSMPSFSTFKSLRKRISDAKVVGPGVKPSKVVEKTNPIWTKVILRISQALKAQRMTSYEIGKWASYLQCDVQDTFPDGRFFPKELLLKTALLEIIYFMDLNRISASALGKADLKVLEEGVIAGLPPPNYKEMMDGVEKRALLLHIRPELKPEDDKFLKSLISFGIVLWDNLLSARLNCEMVMKDSKLCDKKKFDWVVEGQLYSARRCGFRMESTLYTLLVLGEFLSQVRQAKLDCSSALGGLLGCRRLLTKLLSSKLKEKATEKSLFNDEEEKSKKLTAKQNAALQRKQAHDKREAELRAAKFKEESELREKQEKEDAEKQAALQRLHELKIIQDAEAAEAAAAAEERERKERKEKERKEKERRERERKEKERLAKLAMVTWSCERCTLENEQEASSPIFVCSACEWEKPSDTPRSVAAISPKITGNKQQRKKGPKHQQSQVPAVDLEQLLPPQSKELPSHAKDHPPPHAHEAPVFQAKKLPHLAETSSNPMVVAIATLPSKPPTLVKNSAWKPVLRLPAGLSNDTGRNSCFLNTVLQSLFFLDSVREKILQAPLSHCKTEQERSQCFMCSLFEVFSALKANESTVNSHKVREALSFSGFKVDEMADAQEALLEVLTQMNKYFPDVVGCNVALGVECPHCLEQVREGTSSLPSDAQDFVHKYKMVPLREHTFTVYVKDTNAFLLPKVAQYRKFQDLVLIVSNDEMMSCTYCDAGQLEIERKLLKTPKVYILGFTWHPNPSKEDIESLLRRISLHVDIGVLEGRVMDTSSSTLAELRSVTCFYGQHWMCFIRPTKETNPNGDWFLFDDKTVKYAASTWTACAQYMLSYKAQPVSLFYEVDDKLQRESCKFEAEDWNNTANNL